MENTRVQELPIGVNASVRYVGCDIDKWLEFGNQIARVRLVSQGHAACLLKNGKTTWAKLNELERVLLPSGPARQAPLPDQRTVQEIPPQVQPRRDTSSSSAQRTTQARTIDPSGQTTVREMPLTWRGFQP